MSQKNTRKKAVKQRGWIIVLNNWTHQERANLCALVASGVLSYLAFSEEIGVEKGTPHLQGCCQTPTRVRLKQAIRCLANHRIKVIPKRGDWIEAIEYCQKDNNQTFVEFGERPKQGRRIDLEDARDLLNTGVPLSLVAQELPMSTWCHAYKALSEFDQIHSLKATESRKRNVWRPKPEVYVLWGPTNTGKSHLCRGIDEDYVFWVTEPQGSGGVWWKGIDPLCQTLVLDEFYGWLKLSFMLRLMDCSPLELEFKGGSTKCPNLKKIVITSNSDPRDWYREAWKKRPLTEEAFFRRLTRVFHVKTRDEVGRVILCLPTSTFESNVEPNVTLESNVRVNKSVSEWFGTSFQKPKRLRSGCADCGKGLFECLCF